MIGDAHRALFPNNVKLGFNEEITFDFPHEETVASTRFWAKMGCDEDGHGCALGSSGGPGQDGCAPEGCSPPVDSKFEATWNDRNTAEPVDWWDTSGVDGYTLPYTLDVDSKCPQGISLDCRDLTLADCPRQETLGDLAVDLLLKDSSGAPLGCYSPCGKLTYSNWGNSPTYAPQDEEAQMYCCPTPPVSSEACRQGPVEQTEYVKVFRQKCSSVYSYAYDDAVGLQTCPVGTTYSWTLHCPV